jgi:hypothetical protein
MHVFSLISAVPLKIAGNKYYVSGTQLKLALSYPLSQSFCVSALPKPTDGRGLNGTG